MPQLPCPRCLRRENRVVDSRLSKSTVTDYQVDGHESEPGFHSKRIVVETLEVPVIKRRRRCECGFTWRTLERTDSVDVARRFEGFAPSRNFRDQEDWITPDIV